MPDVNIVRQVHKSLMHTIRAAVGTEMFQHIYVIDKRTGVEFDAANEGEDSCAFVVSGILALHGLIDHPHATVTTTINKLHEFGWRITKTPKPGDVVVWPRKNDDRHMGFYLGDSECLSNSTLLRHPVIHKLILSDGRQPEAYYTLDELHSSKTVA